MHIGCNFRYLGNGAYMVLRDDGEIRRSGNTVLVRLPSDRFKKENYQSLSGPVITYNLKGSERHA